MIAVDLHLRGPFHVGELGVGHEETLSYIPSDTLYSALVSAWVARGKRGPFDPSPLRITSAFPRVGSFRLYPTPFVCINVSRERRDALGKALTNCAWCSERVFARLIQGADLTPLAQKANFVGGVWFDPADLAQLPPPPNGEAGWRRFWATRPPAPHVALDRVSNAPNLFHTGRATFGPGCGLWFGVEYAVDDGASALGQALDYLADAGLGGMRSTGHGAFRYEMGGSPPRLPQLVSEGKPAYAVTLSRYLPDSAAEAAAALQAPRAAYKLVRVGGWCQDDAGHPWRRRQVRFAREGSVLGWSGGQLGSIADLKPDRVGQFGGRRVLRYGLAFPVPVAEEALL